MADIVQKASVKGILTGSERISPVMDAVKAQIRLKAELFVTFMGVLKEVNPQLWSVVDNYHTSCECIISVHEVTVCIGNYCFFSVASW